MKLPKPDWDYWLNLPRTSLAAACALSCDIDASELHEALNAAGGMDGRVPKDKFNAWAKELDSPDREKVQSYMDRLHWGRSAIKALTLPTVDHGTVTLASFRAWGESLPRPLTFPPEYPLAALEAQQPHGWPWGTYETKLLRDLAAAAERWWVNYDPDQPDTAPRSKDVQAWLENRGVGRRVAEVMAQILRADGLSTGPR